MGNRGLQRAARAAPSWFPAPRADAASAHLSQLHHRIRSAAFDDFTGGHDTVASHPPARGTSLPASAFSVMAILVVTTAHAAAPEDAYSACRVPAGDGPTARPCLRPHRAAPRAYSTLGKYQWLKQTPDAGCPGLAHVGLRSTTDESRCRGPTTSRRMNPAILHACAIADDAR